MPGIVFFFCELQVFSSQELPMQPCLCGKKAWSAGSVGISLKFSAKVERSSRASHVRCAKSSQIKYFVCLNVVVVFVSMSV